MPHLHDRKAMHSPPAGITGVRLENTRYPRSGPSTSAIWSSGSPGLALGVSPYWFGRWRGLVVPGPVVGRPTGMLWLRWKMLWGS